MHTNDQRFVPIPNFKGVFSVYSLKKNWLIKNWLYMF